MNDLVLSPQSLKGFAESVRLGQLQRRCLMFPFLGLKRNAGCVKSAAIRENTFRQF